MALSTVVTGAFDAPWQRDAASLEAHHRRLLVRHPGSDVPSAQAWRWV